MFSLHSAKANGILEKLLKPVGKYFGQDARTNYLQRCAIKYAKNSLLGDIDVMMILKIEPNYYTLCGTCCNSESQARENLGRKVPVQEECAKKKYHELFDAARSINMARLTQGTRIE